MAQKMYKHEALIHLVYCVAFADKSDSDVWSNHITNAEFDYFNKIMDAEGIELDFSEFIDKRIALRAAGGDESIFDEALKATNGCARAWRVKAYGYMWRMALKSWEGRLYDDGEKREVSVNEKALLDKALNYFGITEAEDEQSIDLTKV